MERQDSSEGVAAEIVERLQKELDELAEKVEEVERHKALPWWRRWLGLFSLA